MDLGLSGKVAIVTGASQGLGFAAADYLRREGAKVVICARSEEKLKALAAEHKADFHPIVADLSEAGSGDDVTKKALEHFGRIDILINNVGTSQNGTFLDVEDRHWEECFELKFMAAVRMSRSCWPELSKNNASIVNVLGISGLVAFPAGAVGGSINAAMVNLTKTLSQVGIKDGVRVNGVSPGLIEAESSLSRVQMRADKENISLEEAKKRVAAHLGVDRLGTGDEFASLVAYLCSPVAAYCQGGIFEIDGGQNKAL